MYSEYNKQQLGGQEQLDVNKPTLINFWADWCGFSQKFLPVWEEFKKNYKSKFPELQVTELNYGKDVKLDPDLTDIAKKAKVEGYPTLVIFANNKKCQKTAGNMTLDELNKFVEKNLGSV